MPRVASRISAEVSDGTAPLPPGSLRIAIVPPVKRMTIRCRAPYRRQPESSRFAQISTRESRQPQDHFIGVRGEPFAVLGRRLNGIGDERVRSEQVESGSSIPLIAWLIDSFFQYRR